MGISPSRTSGRPWACRPWTPFLREGSCTSATQPTYPATCLRRLVPYPGLVPGPCFLSRGFASHGFPSPPLRISERCHPAKLLGREGICLYRVSERASLLFAALFASSRVFGGGAFSSSSKIKKTTRTVQVQWLPEETPNQCKKIESPRTLSGGICSSFRLSNFNRDAPFCQPPLPAQGYIFRKIIYLI